MGYLINYSEWRRLYEVANGELEAEQLSQIDSTSGTFKLNKEAATAYNQMVASAKNDGISWEIDNSYRDIEKQKELVNRLGLYSQGGLAAEPGKSNHGWGSAVDLKVKKGDAAHKWLVANAGKFGFSTIPREPWHWEHRASAEALKKAAAETTISPQAADITLDDIKNRKVALRTGMSGEAVRIVQTKLMELGLLTTEPTGEYDAATYNAVKVFQINNQLNPDGVVGHRTYAKMFEKTVEPVASQVKNNIIDKKAVYNYLKTKMSDNHALGILANIQSESNFNSAAIGDNGTSGGLFQHHATRFSSLKSALGEENWKTNWKGQIDFALSEKPGKQYLAQTFDSPQSASEWWVRVFEVPANIEKQVALRKANVDKISNDLLASGVSLA